MPDGWPPNESPLFGLSQRLPPSNLEAEQALLGAIFANNRAYQLAVDVITGEHFADPIHGRIFREIARTIDSGGIADAVTLKARFENSGVLNEVGGTAYLAQLLSAMVGINNARDYAYVIRDTWLRRQAISAGEALVNNAFGADPEFDAEDVLQAGMDSLLTLAAGCRRRGSRTFAQALDDVLDEAEATRKGEGQRRLNTGIRTLDAIWGGLWPGLDVLAARSGHGKTVLGMQIAEAACEQLQPGETVQVYSLEMPTRDLVLRMYQARTGVSADSVRAGRIEETADRLLRARREMGSLPLDIVDTPSMGLTDIVIRAKADIRRLNTKLIVIDHLHRIAPPAHMNKTIRLEQVRYISAALKDLSGDLGIPILCLAQLSADVERRPDHKPRISDIEYLPERDADNIVLFWRPCMYATEPPNEDDFKSAELFEKAKGVHYAKINKWKGKAQAIAAKRRFGATDDVTLTFDETTLRFADVESV